jgi:hydrogenase maturation factor
LLSLAQEKVAVSDPARLCIHATRRMLNELAADFQLMTRMSDDEHAEESANGRLTPTDYSADTFDLGGCSTVFEICDWNGVGVGASISQHARQSVEALIGKAVATGRRPSFILYALHSGNLSRPGIPEQFNEVVAAIAEQAAALGITHVAGQARNEPEYRGQSVVTMFCFGSKLSPPNDQQTDPEINIVDELSGSAGSVPPTESAAQTPPIEALHTDTSAETAIPADFTAEVSEITLNAIPDCVDPAQALADLLADTTVSKLARTNLDACSSPSVFKIDFGIQSSEAEFARADAAESNVRTVSASVKGLAVEHPIFRSAYDEARSLVAEACQDLICSGAKPLGILMGAALCNTNADALSTGSEFARGIVNACDLFHVPVSLGDRSAPVAGNISSTFCAFGALDRDGHSVSQGFKDEGDVVILLGAPIDLDDPLQGLAGSALLRASHRITNGFRASCKMEEAQRLHNTLLGLIYQGVVKSAKPCRGGGLAVCISECATDEASGVLGASIDLTKFADVRTDALFFGETRNRIVITTTTVNSARVVKQAGIMGVPAYIIGTVGGGVLAFKKAATEFNIEFDGLGDDVPGQTKPETSSEFGPMPPAAPAEIDVG